MGDRCPLCCKDPRLNTLYTLRLNTMRRLLLYSMLILSIRANPVHEIVERVQMMQNTYHVDALNAYTWYYSKLWEEMDFQLPMINTSHGTYQWSRNNV